MGVVFGKLTLKHLIFKRIRRMIYLIRYPMTSGDETLCYVKPFRYVITLLYVTFYKKGELFKTFDVKVWCQTFYKGTFFLSNVACFVLGILFSVSWCDWLFFTSVNCYWFIITVLKSTTLYSFYIQSKNLYHTKSNLHQFGPVSWSLIMC